MSRCSSRRELRGSIGKNIQIFPLIYTWFIHVMSIWDKDFGERKKTHISRVMKTLITSLFSKSLNHTKTLELTSSSGTIRKLISNSQQSLEKSASCLSSISYRSITKSCLHSTLSFVKFDSPKNPCSKTNRAHRLHIRHSITNSNNQHHLRECFLFI